MLLTTAVQQFFFRLFAFIISIIYSTSGGYTAPSTENPINTSRDGANVVFAALADPQISNYMFGRYPVLQAASDDLHASECDIDAVLLAGDIAENGLAEEYQLVYDELSGLDSRYLCATGNHDIRLRLYSQSVERFTSFANALNEDEAMKELHFSEVINGYKFIVLGSDKTMFEEAYYNDAQLEWLESEIAGENGKPVFVICHQPLKLTHGLPTTWGSGTNEGAGHVGDQSEAIKEIITKYNNVIFISGHLHSGLGEYTYETKGKAHLVNLPSLCIENKDGSYNDAGIGYMVEVYDDEIIFRARDFAKGIWLPDYDIKIPVAVA